MPAPCLAAPIREQQTPSMQVPVAQTQLTIWDTNAFENRVFTIAYWMKTALPDGVSLCSAIISSLTAAAASRLGQRLHVPIPWSKLSLCCSSRLFPRYIRPFHTRASSLRHHATPSNSQKKPHVRLNRSVMAAERLMMS